MEVRHLRKAHRRVQATAGLVAMGDAGDEHMGIGAAAAGLDEGLHQLRADAMAADRGGEVDGRFQRVAVGRPFFPRMGVAVADDVAASVDGNEIGGIRRDVAEAAEHLLSRWCDGFKGYVGVHHIVGVDGGDLRDVGFRCLAYAGHFSLSGDGAAGWCLQLS